MFAHTIEPQLDDLADATPTAHLDRPDVGKASVMWVPFVKQLDVRRVAQLSQDRVAEWSGFLCESAPPNGRVTMNSRGSWAAAAAPLSIVWRITRRTAFIVRAYVVGVATAGELSAFNTPRTGWRFVTRRVKSATNSLAVASVSAAGICLHEGRSPPGRRSRR